MANWNMVSIAQQAIDHVGSKVLPEEIAAIAKRHSVLAAGTAWVPIPGASAAAEIANIWLMFKQINDALGLELSKHKLKTLASGIVAELGAWALIQVGVVNLLKFIPGVGTASSGVIGMAIYSAVTYTSAYVYLKMISRLAADELMAMDAEALKAEVADCMEDSKGEIEHVMKDAKETFKDVKNEYTDDDAAAFHDIAAAAAEDGLLQARFCPQCGAKLKDGAKFCMACGARI